ncbi:MAG: glycosyltransferase, partial [Bacteroidota bacterium]
MPTRPLKFLLAGGGTGGHLFPALAIADALKARLPDSRFLFAGRRDKIEGRVVPERGYPFAPIWISGFHRNFRPGNLMFPLRVGVSLLQAFFLIRRFKPDVAIGTGSYVAAPVVFMASLLGIPTILHESNSEPGFTTRLLARKATRVFTGFAETADRLGNRGNIETVGTPTRSSLG